jgi:hypothetical protein
MDSERRMPLPSWPWPPRGQDGGSADNAKTAHRFDAPFFF